MSHPVQNVKTTMIIASLLWDFVENHVETRFLSFFLSLHLSEWSVCPFTPPSVVSAIDNNFLTWCNSIHTPIVSATRISRVREIRSVFVAPHSHWSLFPFPCPSLILIGICSFVFPPVRLSPSVRPSFRNHYTPSCSFHSFISIVVSLFANSAGILDSLLPSTFFYYHHSLVPSLLIYPLVSLLFIFSHKDVCRNLSTSLSLQLLSVSNLLRIISRSSLIPSFSSALLW